MAKDFPEPNASDIAIVGLSLRVPGASNSAEFWSNLRNGVESIETRSVEQLIAAGESADRLRRKNYVPRTAELPGMADFDAEFFGFSPKDAAIMDPQHRQFLECAWEAMEDAARTPESIAGPVGIFAGCGMGSYFYFNVCSHGRLVDQVGLFLLRHTGNDKDFLATRASYLFDLRGPSVNIQTACSTSLVAVHYACQSILNGECDMALAGGVTIEFPHGCGYLYQEGEVLAPDGHCRAFDHRAAGTVFGSGVGVVALRRLTDALADGDPIRAVIRATAVNNDGVGKASYLAPSVTGQAEAIVEAHVLAGISADTIQYVECHGTGTNLGDPIEIAAMSEAFRQSTVKTGFCRVGSVKTNIGHLDTAAGVVSLIKTVLALEHGEIPPSLGYEKPNPAIDFATSPFIVNDRLTPWPTTVGPRRAGVNSLGVGGTNAHAIVEEAPKPRTVGANTAQGPHLIAISARNRNALDDLAARLCERLRGEPDLDLNDVAYTLINGRRRLRHRRVYAVGDRQDAIHALSAADERRGYTHVPIEQCSGAVLMFPGGGAQSPAMARQLYKLEPVFQKTVDEGLAYLPVETSAQIRRLWLESDATDAQAAVELRCISLQLPAILILEVALARLWQSWELKPTALIGHSLGEYAAACIAGVMSLETAVRLVLLRGVLLDEITGGGTLSVQLPAEKINERLPSDLDLAVVNAPELSVVSGPMASLEAFQATLAAEGIDASMLPMNVAAHSRMLQPVLGRFENFLRAEKLSAPQIPIVSNLTGTWLQAGEATDPLYWVRHLRSTVRFADGLATLAEDKSRVYIEAGPGRTLSSLAKAQGTIDSNAVINSLPHSDEQADDRLSFLAAVGRAWAIGLDLPIDRTWDGAPRRRVRLPTYPFQHQRYFLDRLEAPSASADAPAPVKLPDIATWGWRPAWKPAYADRINGARSEATQFLIFLDDGGVGEEMVARLRADGHRVATVSLGDSFAMVADDAFVLCPEQGREGYDRLLRHLAANGGAPGHVVHLWLLTADTNFRPGSSFFHRNQERGFSSLFYLAQALANEIESPDLQITVLTNGMQRVGSEPLVHPDKATVLGPVKVAPRELPGVHVRAIDLPMSAARRTLAPLPAQLAAIADWLQRPTDRETAKSIVELIWDDLFAKKADEIVAYRDGRRFVQIHEAVRLDNPAAGAAAFRENCVCLITGGLGDLATACAIDLAKRFKARIALLGRLELPPRADWPRYRAIKAGSNRIRRAIASIDAIENAGGEVLYLRADVTNPEAMRRVIAEARERFGPLNCVLHAAGVVNDGLIPLKTQAEIDDVLAPKVLGTMVLDEALAGEELDLVVLFSSTSTDTAPAGQVDYVAANSYLNAFAESRAGDGEPRTVAVHWGVWNEVGLAAKAIRDDAIDTVSRAVEPAGQPLYDMRVSLDDDAESEWLELEVMPSSHWLLDEHRLASGEAIWPGTGYLELAVEASRAFGLGTPVEIGDLTFLRPLYVADGQVKTVRTRLKRDGRRLQLSIESGVETASGLGWLAHAEATVQLLPARKPKSLDLAAQFAECATSRRAPPGAALRSAQEDHLKFGPRWRVLREMHLGRTTALAKLQLDGAFHADLDRGLMLHPALMDIATGFAMELIPGYDAAHGLWVPLSYGAVRIYASLPATIWARAEIKPADSPGAGIASFDVTIADRDGRVLCEVERLTLKQLGRNADFSASLRSTVGAIPDASAASKQQREPSPGLIRLAAQVEQGIAPHEGFEALLAGLGAGLPQIVISSIDLELLKTAAANVEPRAAAATELGRSQSASTSAPPSTEVEKTLAKFWSELLGIDTPGIEDSFFDLGGHSLVAVRLFRMIKKAYAIDLPISVLFEAPTIAQTARIIERSRPDAAADAEGQTQNAPEAIPQKARFTHVVQIHAGKRRHATPLFVCAGMFGNILNLRHLGVQIGQDRPVYGLQARGLYGDQSPHETFEEMAQDYLAEIRAVQPHGPYLLAGFSGGGLVAYEMAQQLTAAGETVASLIMLDTPYPEEVHLSFRDRLTMKLEDLRQQKGAFLTRWIRSRIAWEWRRWRKTEMDEASSEQFHNVAVEAAFRRALSAYNGKRYDGPVVVLRPKLEIAYHLLDGRKLNADRCLLKADNGWKPYVEHLAILEVPGDHDSMVLEPNVRVLARIMREELRSADQPYRLMPAAAE